MINDINVWWIAIIFLILIFLMYDVIVHILIYPYMQKYMRRYGNLEDNEKLKEILKSYRTLYYRRKYLDRLFFQVCKYNRYKKIYLLFFARLSDITFILFFVFITYLFFFTNLLPKIPDMIFEFFDEVRKTR